MPEILKHNTSYMSPEMKMATWVQFGQSRNGVCSLLLPVVLSFFSTFEGTVNVHSSTDRSGACKRGDLRWWSSWLWGSRWWAPSWPGWGSSSAGRRSKGSVSSSRRFPLCTLALAPNSGHGSYDCTVLGSSARTREKENGVQGPRQMTNSQRRPRNRQLPSRVMRLWASDPAKSRVGDHVDRLPHKPPA